MDNLRIIYADILKGYSTLETPHYSGVFIKHLTAFDIANVDLKYNYYYEKALKQKVLTEKEQLKFLEEQELWGKKEEQEIKDLEITLSSLEKTKSKCIVKAEIKLYNDEINKTKEKLGKLQISRAEYLTGKTAESYASKKVNDYYLFISLYNKDLITPFFEEEEFEELNEDELLPLIKIYNEKLDYFKTINLKKISISNFFVNSFLLAENDPYRYYGKPIVNLTFYQSELFSFGKYFTPILRECQDKVSEEVLQDPEKLIEWYQGSENARKILEKTNNKDSVGGTAIVGATKEDLKAMGVDTSDSLNLSEELKKHGGSMNFQEILKLHGV